MNETSSHAPRLMPTTIDFTVQRLRALLLLALLLSASAALSSTSAPVYGFTPIRENGSGSGNVVAWDLAAEFDNKVSFTINQAGCADSGSFTGGVDEFTAVVDSFQQWANVRGSNLVIRYEGTSGAGDSNDGRNAIVFDNAGALGAGIFGVTTTYFTSAGVITEADMVLNDSTFAWDTLGYGTTGTVGRAFIENIVTHEAGHFLGLDHSFNASATMYPQAQLGAINGHSLNADDAAGIAAAYPDSPVLAAEFASISGTVLKGGTPVFAAQVILVDAVTHEASAAALTFTDGTFSIPRIPPGEYLVYCTPADKARLGSFYASGDTDVHAMFLGSAGPSTIAQPAVGTHRLQLGAGAVMAGVNFTVVAETTAFEPNDTQGTATSIAYGDLLAARLETPTDVDHYSFTGAVGDIIDVVVHSDQIGSRGGLPKVPTDLELTLLDSGGGTVVAPIIGTPPSDFSPSQFSETGLIRDPRIVAFALPGTDTYTIRIASFGGATSGYYGLRLIRAAADVEPNAAASTLDVAPRSVEAGSGQMFTATVTVRNQHGLILTSDPTLVVRVGFNGVNSLTATETPPSSGIFVASLPAQPTPGEVPLTAEVQRGAAPSVPLLRGVRVTFTNVPVSTTTSVLMAAPGFAIADGVTRIAVRLEPRDANGLLIDDLTLAPTLATTGGTITAVFTHQADGTWLGQITAPTTAQTATVTADVLGPGTIATTQVEFVSIAAGQGGPPAPPPSGGGDNGCMITGGSTNPVLLLLMLALLAMLALMRGLLAAAQAPRGT